MISKAHARYCLTASCMWNRIRKLIVLKYFKFQIKNFKIRGKHHLSSHSHPPSLHLSTCPFPSLPSCCTAKEYVDSDPSGRKGIPITTIKQGAEPPTFTGWFQAWDPKMWDTDPLDRIRARFWTQNSRLSVYVWLLTYPAVPNAVFIHFNFNPQVPKTNAIVVITLNSRLGNSAVYWAS